VASTEKLSVMLTGSAKDFTKSIQQVKTTVKGATKDFSGWYASIRKSNNQLSNITKDANRASTSIKGLSTAMKGFNQVIGASKMYLIADVIAKGIKSNMDMIETVNLFSVSMGQLAVETDAFAQSMSDVMGLDKTNIQSSIGTFNLLARSMGMTDKNAQTLSTNTAKLALDLSSLTNVPINQVMQVFTFWSYWSDGNCL